MKRLYDGDNRKWLSDQKSLAPQGWPISSVVKPEADYDTVFHEARGQISSTDSDIQRFGQTCDRRKANSRKRMRSQGKHSPVRKTCALPGLQCTQKRNGMRPFLFCFCLNDYCNETSSIRK